MNPQSRSLSSTQILDGNDPSEPQLTIYNGDGNSFHVTSTLVTSGDEAVVIDSGFTRGDALRIVANVIDSGKTLKTILISNADPDYHFGSEVLRRHFPDADVVAAAPVAARIAAKLPAKLAFWGPKLGGNGPVEPVIPRALSGDRITVGNQTLELRGLAGPLAHRPWLWLPSRRAILGNIAIFGGLHVWTADARSADERAAWLAQLDEMEALAPAIVVPGHMRAQSPLDAAAIGYTRAYLRRFAVEAAAATNGAALIAAMQAAYPDVGLPAALDIGAKVAKGEMSW